MSTEPVAWFSRYNLTHRTRLKETELELKMFYQTYTACKSPKSPPTAAEWRHLQRAQRAFCPYPWWPWPLTFDLDIQTRPSEKPNTTSVRIWRKSVQQFATYLKHRQKDIDGAKNRTLPCGNYTDSARPYLPSSALYKTPTLYNLHRLPVRQWVIFKTAVLIWTKTHQEMR